MAQPNQQELLTATPKTPNGADGAKALEVKPDALVTTDGEPSRAISAFSGQAAFETAQRMARALASSSLVPTAYQNNIPNTLIAMELANRIGCSVLMAMQSLAVVHGKPTWEAKFLIGTVNVSGQFSKIRYRWEGTPGKDDWGCRAWARDLETKEECVGPLVTIGIAKREGWYERKGSKWQTIPELMLCYRSATWWSRLFCPELGLGMQTREEIIDTHGELVSDTTATPAAIMPGSPQALEAELMGADPETGELPDLEV